MPPQHLHSENCSNTRLDMSHSSSNTFETHNNNNNGGSTKIDVTSAYIANMKMLNQLMMNHSQRQLLSKNNSLSLLPLPTSGRHFSHQLTPNDSPESVRETNTSLAFSHSGNQFYKQGNNSPSDHHPKGLDCINLFDTLETVDAAVYLAQSQDSNGYNSSLGDRAYGQLEKHTVFCPMEEQEDQEREYGDFSRGEDEDAAAGTGSQHDGNENRFRHYQADQWTSMLEDLIEFRRRHGHCNVPHTSKELPALGRWVKRQRYQYKLMQEGKKESTMTPERAQVLEQVGFIWDAHGSTWHRRFQELYAFYLDQGHCNVPSNFPLNPQLSTWVKFQRRQYKAQQKDGQNSGRFASGQSLTPVRIRALEDMGFQWELRRNRNTQGG